MEPTPPPSELVRTLRRAWSAASRSRVARHAEPDPAGVHRAVHVLALVRWGETGFCCPKCRCLRWKPVSGRPRVRRCAVCHVQISVTSGTPFMFCRLPLERLVPLLDSSRVLVPRVREVQRALGEVSLSTAHHVVVRILRVWKRMRTSGGDAMTRHVQRLPFRKARRAMLPWAPDAIRDLDRRRLTDPNVRVTATLALTASDGVRSIALEAPVTGGPAVRIDRGLRRWLGAIFGAQRRMSLRWMPLWLNAFVVARNIDCGAVPFRGALVEIVAAPHVSRRSGDPWRDQRADRPWRHESPHPHPTAAPGG